MAQVRHAVASWQGDLPTGSGTVRGATSGAIGEMPTTWRARAEAADTGLTSPEELLAAAHAACFSMALSNILAKAGTPLQRVDVTAEVTADRREPGFTVLSSKLTVRGRVAGIGQAAFAAAAATAKDGCPISRALKGNVELMVEATLEA